MVSQTFVHIRSREQWLNQAVLGMSNRGEMHPGVLADLRETVVNMERRVRSGLPATNAEEELEGDIDPRDEMVTVCETPDKKPKKKTSIHEPGLPNRYE